MTSFDKASLIIKAAGKDKSNYQKYDKALKSLAAIERRSGNVALANFILEELSEALAVATETP